jgi:hypothetical protein
MDCVDLAIPNEVHDLPRLNIAMSWVSFGTLYLVALVITDVSEEDFQGNETRYHEDGHDVFLLNVSSNRARCSSETSLLTRGARYKVPEDICH